MGGTVDHLHATPDCTHISLHVLLTGLDGALTELHSKLGGRIVHPPRPKVRRRCPRDSSHPSSSSSSYATSTSTADVPTTTVLECGMLLLLLLLLLLTYTRSTTESTIRRMLPLL
jgi:hypothetical protein